MREPRTALATSHAAFMLLKQLDSSSDSDSSVDHEAAIVAVRSIAETAGVTRIDDVRIPGIPAGTSINDFRGWTADRVRAAADCLGQREGKDRAALVGAAIDHLERRVGIGLRAVEFGEELKARLAPLSLLPDAATLEKTIRYEAHLNRQLVQTLNTLEALQGRRQGRPTPLARVDINGLP